ncbi:two-component sensor histidine kinase [Actinoplanes ianthinogenes]|uniref:histidine kinase n=1 Tax=Actinoplanes ianthinogenes TaxID=122358 RepID=A0ABN6CR70_9ACTN|nr:two-component sensor histidine kinase [Actinoplanes ianthinogenes]GGR02948.1 two-component sensor histidine kinase [Actinoplanes ianthinogenes]
MRWLLLDGLAAAAFELFAFGILGARESNPALAVAATALAAATVPAARRWPLAAAAGALAVFWLSPISSRYAWIALVPLAYALLRCAERHRPAVAAVALAAALTGPVASALPSLRRPGGIVPFALVLAVAWTVGVALRQRRRYGEELVGHEGQRAADRAARERARIARELHDVVAHGMTVMTVQATYGRLVVQDRPAEAAAALVAIETTGRQSLAELRRLLGVLRTAEPDPADDDPAPGLADLPRLVAHTERAGVRVDVAVTGDPAGLSPGLDLSAYRIVQEALTNVVRHAGTGTARVTVEHRPDAVVLDIVDGGRGGDVRQEGHGLTGMRERVALYGGTLMAGPVPGGGFRVHATLPKPADEAS